MKQVQVYEVKHKEGLLLNANELYQNVSQVIKEEIKEAVDTIAFQRYPDPENTELIEAYAKVRTLSANQILAGNGSDEMLGLLIGYFLGKGKTLFTLQPDFSMYDYYATMYEADVLKFPCEEDGSFDIQAFISMGLEKKVDMVLFSNPNNPSGHMLSNASLIEIVEAFSNIPVIIDEAYGEFAQESMIPYLNTYNNLYVTRTLSKAFGLASARLGFLMSNETNIAKLKPMVVPYNISSIAQEIGKIVLNHAKEYEPMIVQIKQDRDEMYEKVKTWKRVSFYPSQANYLYGRCKEKDELLALMKKHHIVIRDYSGKDTFRITIGSKEENDIVYRVLKQFEEGTVCEV